MPTTTKHEARQDHEKRQKRAPHEEHGSDLDKRGAPPASEEVLDVHQAGSDKQVSAKVAAGKPVRDAASNTVLRISFLVPRESIPRLEWLMKVERIPTKVDLLREALRFYEDHIVEKHAKRAEQRRLAGAPPLTDPVD